MKEFQFTNEHLKILVKEKFKVAKCCATCDYRTNNPDNVYTPNDLFDTACERIKGELIPVQMINVCKKYKKDRV